jgi:hypothetical protein
VSDEIDRFYLPFFPAENAEMSTLIRACDSNIASSHSLQFSDELIRDIGGDITADFVRGFKDDQFGVRMEEVPLSLLRSSKDPLRVLTHLVDKTDEPLTEPFINAGMRSVIDRLVQIKELPSPTPGALVKTKELPQADPYVHSNYPSLDAFIQTASRGIVQVPSSEFLPELVFNVAFASPGSSIVVVAHSKKEIRLLESMLRERYPALLGRLDVHMSGREFRPNLDREHIGVIISTFAGLLSLDDFAQSHIVLIANTKQATFERANHALCQVGSRFKLFGVQYRNSPHNLEERATMMRWFGPDKILLEWGKRVRRPVGVEWIPNSLSCQSQTAKRMYWTNRNRNQLIANQARELKRLSELGRSINSLILTNNIPQFRQIAELLPNWSLEIGDETLLGSAGSEVQTRISEDRGNWRRNQNLIVLTKGEYKQRIPGYEYDVLIWAAGTKSIRAIPESWFYRRDDGSEPRPLHIVDIADDGTRLSKQCTQVRRDQYAERNIFPIGVNETTGRIDHFLRQIGRS